MSTDVRELDCFRASEYDKKPSQDIEAQLGTLDINIDPRGTSLSRILALKMSLTSNLSPNEVSNLHGSRRDPPYALSSSSLLRPRYLLKSPVFYVLEA